MKNTSFEMQIYDLTFSEGLENPEGLPLSVNTTFPFTKKGTEGTRGGMLF